MAVCVTGPTDEQAVEITTRLRAELAAAGFEAVVAQVSGDGHEVVEQAARTTGSFAAIGVTRHGGVDAEVWVADRVTGKTALRRVALDAATADAAAIFAIRAVELLKASLLELEEGHPSRGDVQATPDIQKWATPTGGPTSPASGPTLPAGAAPPLPPTARAGSRSSPPTPPRAPSPTSTSPARAAPNASEPSHEDQHPPTRPSKRGRPSFEISAGAALLDGSSSMPAAVGPSLGFSFKPTRHWGGTLQVWGPELSHIRGPEGSAKLDQEGALADAELEPLATEEIRPFVRAGMGAYRLGVAGDPNAAYRARSDQVWAWAGSVGLGARWVGLDPFVLGAALDALVLAPRPGIEFAGRVVGNVARPLLVGQLAIGVEW